MSSSLHRFWFAPLIVLGLAMPQGGPQDPPSPDLEQPEEAVEPGPQLVTAEELWSHPWNYQAKTVLLRVQIHSKLSSWNPLVTRFGDGEYSSWVAWADEQILWEEEDFRAPRVRFFALHDSASDWALSEAEEFDRFELTCVVQSIFANRPWLEVQAVKPLVRHLGEGSLIHGARGLEFIEAKAWDAAISEFERASAGAIPELAKIELARLIEHCKSERPLELYKPKED